MEVTLKEGNLVQGQRTRDKEIEDEGYYRMERSAGKFFRRMALPFDVDADKVEASLKDGTLELVVPAPEE